MGRRIKISGAVLNVRLHPHTPELYASFINDLYQLRTPVKMRGDRYGMISLLDRREADGGVYTGIITTFLTIEYDGEWFDVSDLKEATNEQISKVVIPANLHPNAASFHFYFDTVSHKLYVQTYSDGKALTPASAHALFSGLSDNLAITQSYGMAKITLVQSKEGLANVFSIPTIKSIAITILKPNADIFADDFEEKIEAHLNQVHGKMVTISYEAEPGQSLVPTDDIKAISLVALENGSVAVRGRDDSGAVSRSTENHPKILQDKYDPEAATEEEAFRRLIPPRQIQAR